LKITLPQNFYTFFDDDIEVHSYCYKSNSEAMEEAQKMVIARDRALSVYKGIARVVPETSGQRLTKRAADRLRRRWASRLFVFFMHLAYWCNRKIGGG